MALEIQTAPGVSFLAVARSLSYGFTGVACCTQRLEIILIQCCSALLDRYDVINYSRFRQLSVSSAFLTERMVNQEVPPKTSPFMADIELPCSSIPVTCIVLCIHEFPVLITISLIGEARAPWIGARLLWLVRHRVLRAKRNPQNNYLSYGFYNYTLERNE